MLLATQAKEFQNFDLSRHQANTIYCSIAGVYNMSLRIHCQASCLLLKCSENLAKMIAVNRKSYCHMKVVFFTQ